jgi:hypothetical protein
MPSLIPEPADGPPIDIGARESNILERVIAELAQGVSGASPIGPTPDDVAKSKQCRAKAFAARAKGANAPRRICFELLDRHDGYSLSF